MKRMNIQARMAVLLVVVALGVNGLLYGITDTDLYIQRREQAMQQREQAQEKARATRREKQQVVKRMQWQKQEEKRRARVLEAARRHLQQIADSIPTQVERRGERMSEMMKRRQITAEQAREIQRRQREQREEARATVGELYDEFYEVFPVINAVTESSLSVDGRYFNQEPVSLDDESLNALASEFEQREVDLGVLVNFFRSVGQQQREVRKGGFFDEKFLLNYSDYRLQRVLSEVVGASRALRSLSESGVEVGAFSRLHQVGMFIAKIISRRAEVQRLDTRYSSSDVLSSEAEYAALVTQWYGSLKEAAQSMINYVTEYKGPKETGFIEQGDLPKLTEFSIVSMSKKFHRRDVDAGMLKAQIMLFEKIANDPAEALNAYTIEMLRGIYYQTKRFSEVLENIEYELSAWLVDVVLPFIQKVVNAKEIRSGLVPSQKL